MASVRKELVTSARPPSVWDAIRDVGALHTRLVPMMEQGMAAMKTALDKA